MKSLRSALILSFILAILCMGQSLVYSDRNTVFIIGSPHRETSGTKMKDIYSAIEKCKPDIILVECDSGMLGSSFRFSPNLLSVYEFKIAQQYADEHAGVLLRPFDIEGRNKFFQDSQYFERQLQFFNALNVLYQKDSLSFTDKKNYEKSLLWNHLADSLQETDLRFLNSDSTDFVIEKKMNAYYEKFGSLIGNTNGLQKYLSYFEMDSSFWIHRNQKMAEHISSYCRQFTGKRIVVLTGFYHRYMLKKFLHAPSLESYIEIREFYE